MIVCSNAHPVYPDHQILIRQSDHDDHSGRLMSQWDTTRFWKPTNKQLLTTAVALHDTGFGNWEDHAILNPDGKPWTYWEIPPDDHIELHRHGVDVAMKVHPYVGLMVSMHTVGIHRDRLHIDEEKSPWHIREDFTPAVNSFIEEQTGRQANLRSDAEARLGRTLPHERLMNDFRVFEFIDTLSVWIAENMPDGRNAIYVPDVTGKSTTLRIQRVGHWEFKISPFPFYGQSVECPIVARLLPSCIFENWHEFHEAWYGSKVITLPYVCVS